MNKKQTAELRQLERQAELREALEAKQKQLRTCYEQAAWECVQAARNWATDPDYGVGLHGKGQATKVAFHAGQASAYQHAFVDIVRWLP